MFKMQLWNFKEATWNAWKAAWNACADSIYKAYCDDLAYKRDRLEKGYYEQVQKLNQRYESLEKQNAHLLKLIMEKNNLDPMPNRATI